jgi:hypothetical protein
MTPEEFKGLRTLQDCRVRMALELAQRDSVSKTLHVLHPHDHPS